MTSQSLQLVTSLLTMLALSTHASAATQQSSVAAELSQIAEGTLSIPELLSKRPGITGEIIHFIDHNPDSVLSTFGIVALARSDEFSVALALTKWSRSDTHSVRSASISSMRTIYLRQIPLGENRPDSYSILLDHWRESLQVYVTEYRRRTDDYLAYTSAEMLILQGEIEDSNLVSMYLECSLIPFSKYQSTLETLNRSSHTWATKLLERERKKLADLAKTPVRESQRGD
jgi:hypothetical protein